LSVFAEIDAVLEPWAESNGRVIFRAFAGEEARFFYWSSARGECFQISLEPAETKALTVHAWTIETWDDRETHEEWHTSIAQLNSTLDAAFTRIQAWANEPEV